MKKQVILIGRINQGHLPIGGETAKNQALVSALSKCCRVTPLDFYRNKQRPWVYLQTLWALLTQPKATIILSTTASNIYPLLKAFKMLGIRRNIIHWIVGGEFDKLVEAGRYDVDVLKVANLHLAQSRQMAERLNSCGLNVKYIPNFRQIARLPQKKITQQTGKTRFVFMSRIMKEKGVGDILACVAMLNARSLQEHFTVDFYGRLDENYKIEFERTIMELPNVHYYGTLDLRNGYDTLASYDAMLFPTFHPSEGIAGAIIDAFIAGVPVIASDWGHNREIVDDGITGIIVPVHDTEALGKVMEKIIQGKIDLHELSRNAQLEARNYNAENVISEDFLKKISIL